MTPSDSYNTSNDVLPPPSCSLHGSLMYPVNWQGERVSERIGLWQCRACADAFLAALDAEAGRSATDA